MQAPVYDQHIKNSICRRHSNNIFLHNWKATLREFSVLLFIFSIWAISQSVLANENDARDSYSSLWLQAVETEKTDNSQRMERFAALQLATNVDIEVSGPIARVLVKQRFYNPSQLWAEGEYIYPLPENAAVDHLRMHIGDRVIEGQIQEKKRAVETFAKARKEGKRASLLSQRRTNRFRTQVTNIAPNENLIIEFEYQQWIDFKDGAYSLVFPMVSTPSYTPSQQEGSKATLDPAFVYPDNDYIESSDGVLNPVSINVDINSGIPIEAPESVSHVVSHKAMGANSHQISMKGSAQLSNRDFVLSWRPASSTLPTVTVLKEEIDGERYGLLMIMPPQLDNHENSLVPRELIMVLDVSGSMQGESLDQAKLALLEALDLLREDDLFNLIWFNNSAYSLFRDSQLASARNIVLARHQVNNLRADGGTNMLPAIDKALKKNYFNDDSALLFEPLRQVVFITDGAVGNEAELFTTIRQKLGSSRLFTVGIGSAPNSYFMRKAALAGRGTFTKVNQAEQVKEKVGALMKKLQSPALTHIELDFQGYTLDVLPNPLPDLYVGEPLYVAFKANEFPEYLHLSARLDGETSYLNTPLNDQVLNHSRDQRGIAKEWARRKIEYFQQRYAESQGDDREKMKERITQLALNYDLVTPYTSLVAVDVTPERGGGLLHRTKIPANFPKAWAMGSQQQQSIRLAQTATGMWSYIYSGLICMLIGCFCWSLSQSKWIKEKECV